MFNIEKEIDRGTHGIVYKGTFQEKDVAIKKFNICGQFEVFKDEMEIYKKLNHDNILKMLYTDNTTMILELCESDLDKIVKKGKKIDKKKFLLDIGRGLEYLHSLEIIHSDLSPGNILLTKGNFKISDFGFATTPKDRFYNGTYAYTAPYIFPYNKKKRRKIPFEILCKGDFFSLGLCLYYINHGRHFMDRFEEDYPDIEERDIFSKLKKRYESNHILFKLLSFKGIKNIAQVNLS